jgi:HlyD family secretion protein
MRGPIYNPAGGSRTLGLSAPRDPGLHGCSSVYLLAAVVLYACSSTEAGYWQGYVEGEYVYVAAPLAGWLNERYVNRGRRVERGDLLFMLERAPEIAARNEAEARLQRALASLEDLTKGKRPEEIAVTEQQLAQAQAALELSAIQLQRQRRLFASKVVPRGALDEAHTAVERDRAQVRELLNVTGGIIP